MQDLKGHHSTVCDANKEENLHSFDGKHLKTVREVRLIVLASLLHLSRCSVAVYNEQEICGGEGSSETVIINNHRYGVAGRRYFQIMVLMVRYNDIEWRTVRGEDDIKMQSCTK